MLLFALLIMGSVIIGSVGVGTIILDMLQQTRIADNSIAAYYAAESGVEQSLFNTRRTGNLSPSYDADDARVYLNDTRWWGDVTGSTEIIYSEIPQEGVIEVNLFDPDSPADFSSSNISRVDVVWSDSCGGCSVLRASAVGWWPGSGQVAWGSDAARLEQPFEFTGGSASLPLGPPDRLYKLRLRARHATLEDVEIRAYDSAGTRQQLPGQVVIDMFGQQVNSRRRLIATMPRGAPLSGIFDFVIFSECSLVKGGRPISCP